MSAADRARRAHLNSYWPIMLRGSDPVSHRDELQRQAREFREYHGLPLDCGSVLFHMEQPFRFSSNGTKIDDVVPGVVSITHDGFVHVAVGGDPDAGAQEWVLVHDPEAAR